jgi:hypothetical protein
MQGQLRVGAAEREKAFDRIFHCPNEKIELVRTLIEDKGLRERELERLRSLDKNQTSNSIMEVHVNRDLVLWTVVTVPLVLIMSCPLLNIKGF